MNTVTIASDAADAEAIDALKNHHAEMSGTLALLVTELMNAADVGTATRARSRIVAWSRTSLLPHLQAEEKTLYSAAREAVEGRLLVDAMLTEQSAVDSVVSEIDRATTHVDAAAASRALKALFAVHADNVNDHVLPLVGASAEHSIAGLIQDVHDLLVGSPDGQEEPPVVESGGCHGHSGCGCGGGEPAAYPELDVRSIPHAIRHATVFGALDALAEGTGLEIVADHDPVPLLNQVQERTNGRFEIAYVERGPAIFRVRFVALR